MKRVATILTSLALCGSILTIATPAMANNYENTSFSFTFAADGTDYAIKPRAKQDSSASYMKNNSTNSIDVSVFVAGTSSATKYSALTPNLCSDKFSIKKGTYKYMSNTVRKKGYKYAYLVIGSHINKTSKVSGKWSPDNVREIQ